MQLERQFLSYLVTRMSAKVSAIANEHASASVDSATKELQADITELQKAIDAMFETKPRRTRSSQ